MRYLEDVMSHPVLTFHGAVPAGDALATMDEAGVRHAVVVRGPDVIGVVSDRDLGRAGRALRTVADVMQPNPVVATPDTTIVAGALFMRDRGIGCVPVVTSGRLVGIVTRGDLLGALAERRRSTPKRARP